MKYGFVIACHEPDAKYLPHCLSAVSGMTIKPDMVVIANHGNSEAVLQASKADGLEILVLPVPKEVPLPGVYNQGIAHCRTEWVNMFSADDWPHQDYLQIVEDEGANADIVSMKCEVVDEEGRGKTRMGPPPFDHSNPLTVARGTQVIYGCCPFRRSLWERLGGLPDTLVFDWAFFLAGFKAGMRAHVSQRVGFFLRERDNSFSRTQIRGKEKQLMDEVLKRLGLL